MPNMESKILDILKGRKTVVEDTHVKPSYEDLGPAVVSPTTSVKPDYTKGVPTQQLRRMDHAEVSDISGAHDDKGKVSEEEVTENGDGPKLEKGEKVVAENTGIQEAAKEFLKKFRNEKDDDEPKDKKKKNKDCECHGKGCSKCNMKEDAGADKENQRQYDKRKDEDPMQSVDGQKGSKSAVKEGTVPANLPGGGMKATDTGNLKEEEIDEKLTGLPRLKKNQPKSTRAEVGTQKSTLINKIKAEETDPEDKKDMEEDINALFVGEELSEAFKKKALVIFEAAVNLRVKNIVEKAEEEITADLTEQMNEAVEEIVETLSVKCDNFLNYIAEEWVKENALQITNTLRANIAEDFITGLKSLFEQHYISVPNNRVDMVATLANKVESLEEQLNAQLENNVILFEENNTFRKQEIFDEISEGLVAVQVDKLKILAESVDFKNPETYKQNLKILKESNFTSVTKHSQNLTEEITNEPLNIKTTNNSEMAGILAATARLNTK